MRFRRFTRTATAAATIAVVASACGSSSTSSSGTAKASAAAASSDTFTLKIGTSGNSGVFPYAQKYGTFANGLKSLGVKVEWVTTEGAYSTTLAALRTGAINLEDSPLTGVVASSTTNVPVKLFGMTSQDTYPDSGIVVPKGSDIKSVKDLVGKTVVVNPAARGEYILLLALKQEGIPFNEVKRTYLQPPAAAPGFSSGKIQAWSTFTTFFDGAIKEGGRVIAADSNRFGPGSVAVPSDDNLTGFVGNITALEQHPAVYAKFITLYNQLADQARKDPAKFVNVLQSSGPTAVKGQQYTEAIDTNENTWDIHVPGTADDGPIQRISSLFVEGGVIKTQVQPSSIFATLSS